MITKEMILEKLPTPEAAVRAMLDGLRNAEELGLLVRMGTFGHDDEHGVCYGCAATATVLKAGLLTWDEQVALKFEEDKSPIEVFELALDSFRLGLTWPLFSFYGLPDPGCENWHLGTWVWKGQIHKVEAWLAKRAVKPLYEQQDVFQWHKRSPSQAFRIPDDQEWEYMGCTEMSPDFTPAEPKNIKEVGGTIVTYLSTLKYRRVK